MAAKLMLKAFVVKREREKELRIEGEKKKGKEKEGEREKLRKSYRVLFISMSANIWLHKVKFQIIKAFKKRFHRYAIDIIIRNYVNLSSRSSTL